jgi:uncharacterized membrane protein YkvA (DUF1232 family)
VSIQKQTDAQPIFATIGVADDGAIAPLSVDPVARMIIESKLREQSASISNMALINACVPTLR